MMINSNIFMQTNMAKSSWFWNYPSFTNIIMTAINWCDTLLLCRKSQNYVNVIKYSVTWSPWTPLGDVECNENTTALQCNATI